MPKPWKIAARAERESSSASPDDNSSADPIRIALFEAEIGNVPVCDLHGMTTDQARVEAESFINRAFVNRVSSIRIIHGRGTGALRALTIRILEEYKKRGLVTAWADHSNPSQANGVLVVAMHQR